MLFATLNETVRGQGFGRIEHLGCAAKKGMLTLAFLAPWWLEFRIGARRKAHEWKWGVDASDLVG